MRVSCNTDCLTEQVVLTIPHVAPPGFVDPPPPPPPIEYEKQSFYKCTDNGDVVRITHVWVENDPNDAPITTSYLNMTTGMAYTGSVSSLKECPDNDTDSIDEDWCAGGVDYTRVQVTKNGQPVQPPIVAWIQSATGNVVLMPAGVVKGKCELAVPEMKIVPFNLDVSSPSIATNYDPQSLGDTIDLSAYPSLQSYSVDCVYGDTRPNGTNRIRVEYSDGSVGYVVKGQPLSWSVAQQSYGNENIISARFVCEGVSAAKIIGTYQP
jgi:hypothetical protein